MLLQSVLRLIVKSILVTGGAGFIGSHTVHLLLRQGYDVTVVDNLSRGHRDVVPADRLHVFSLQETDRMEELLRSRHCEAVIHFAAYIAVGESMKAPELYFENNVGGSLSLLTAMVRAGVKNLVFSSTAAVYGTPHAFPILEDFPIQPVNPYGESKVMVERLLDWFDRIHGLRSVALRYFNASGADPEGALGERHDPETHLIPLLFRAILSGEPVTLFGDDYPTPDGTCIRDYIHVNDLAQAHILALESLAGGAASERFNVGTGAGNSVREVLHAVEEVTGRKVPHRIGPRREGDPPGLVANADRLRTKLGWSPQFTDIHEIVRTAWQFEEKRAAFHVK
jgi:UDP-glucose-4-epimerase GalE